MYPSIYQVSKSLATIYLNMSPTVFKVPIEMDSSKPIDDTIISKNSIKYLLPTGQAVLSLLFLIKKKPVTLKKSS